MCTCMRGCAGRDVSRQCCGRRACCPPGRSGWAPPPPGRRGGRCPPGGWRRAPTLSACSRPAIFQQWNSARGNKGRFHKTKKISGIFHSIFSFYKWSEMSRNAKKFFHLVKKHSRGSNVIEWEIPLNFFKPPLSIKLTPTDSDYWNGTIISAVEGGEI